MEIGILLVFVYSPISSTIYNAEFEVLLVKKYQYCSRFRFGLDILFMILLKVRMTSYII